MMKKIPNYLKLLFILLPFSVFGQENSVLHSHKTLTDSLEEKLILFANHQITKDTTLLHSIFKETIPKFYNAPGLPRFAILGKNQKYYLGLGGYIKGSVAYDFNGAVDNPIDFIVSDINVPKQDGQQELLQLSALTSNFFLNFVRYHGKNKFSAYVNANFTGPDNSFALQFAYVTFNSWTLGYKVTLFSDVEASVPTIDFQGPNGYVFLYNTVLSYEKAIKNFSFGVSLENPVSSVTFGDSTANVFQNVPEIPAYLKYSWNKKKSWIRVSGLFKSIRYNDLVQNKERYEVGWGIQASGKMQFFRDKLVVYYQGVRGEGISDYIQDFFNLNLDFVPTTNNVGKLDAVKTWAGFLGLQYNFSKKIFASCTYSQAKAFFPDNYVNPSAYHYGQYFVGNVFWNIRPTVQAGVEYLYGKRTNRNDLSNQANRIQTMLQFNF